MVTAIVELVVYCASMKSFAYSIWGFGNPMLFYPVDTFRFLRGLVVVRFICMQKVCGSAQNPHSLALSTRNVTMHALATSMDTPISEITFVSQNLHSMLMIWRKHIYTLILDSK